MYISAYKNIMHTLMQFTSCAKTLGCTNHQLDIRRIRSFPPNCYDISPFSEPRPAPTQTTDSFFHRTFVKNILFPSWECQLPKNAHKKTPTSSFCRFVKKWEQIVTMTILVNYISIHPPPPPEKTKTPHALKNLLFSPGLSLRHHFCGL